MLSRIRKSSLVLLCSLLLYFSVPVSAQIRFEDFSDTTYAQQHLRFNGAAGLGTWNDKGVLRLTDGASNLEGSTVYFRDPIRAQGGKQPLTAGFSAWFQFQVHSPIQCCSPGDGLAFIIQNSNATDTTMCASGVGITALGAGGNPQCPNQTGALGYAGINNSLVIEFDISQDAWDPNGNHIAIQSCGPNTNTPVHEQGDYTIGNNDMVTSCLLSQQAIDTNIKNIGDNCNGETCNDGEPHDVVISYTPPTSSQPGALQIWLDPNFVAGTHDPIGPPTMSVPYNIVYDPNNNPSGLILDPQNGGSARAGFTASQPSASDRRNGISGPSGGTAQDILGWEFTNHGVVQIQEPIQNGGTPTVFAFGEHQTTVTYPQGFMNDNNILMTVTATPVDRLAFYPRLVAGGFPNEQCIVYAGTGGGSPPTATNGRCIVYSYTCQDQMGNQVSCPNEPLCTNPQQSQCIDVNTTFDTMDNVTPTNADYLENDAIGSNNWASIFLSFQSKPIDGTTSGGTRGFGAGGSKPAVVRTHRKAGNVGTADIVATFRPSQP
jgi:hypothetical protein